MTKFQAAQTVCHKIVPFYGKANIPIATELYACNKIVKLLEENQKLREIPSKRRTSPGVLGKVQKAMTELSTTFRLWPDNTEKMIKTEEDQKFLESIKTDRVATFGCFDAKLS